MPNLKLITCTCHENLISYYSHLENYLKDILPKITPPARKQSNPRSTHRWQINIRDKTCGGREQSLFLKNNLQLSKAKKMHSK